MGDQVWVNNAFQIFPMHEVAIHSSGKSNVYGLASYT